MKMNVLAAHKNRLRFALLVFATLFLLWFSFNARSRVTEVINELQVAGEYAGVVD